MPSVQETDIHLQDYNRSVLELVTFPNVFLAWCPSQPVHFHLTPLSSGSSLSKIKQLTRNKYLQQTRHRSQQNTALPPQPTQTTKTESKRHRGTQHRPHTRTVADPAASR